MSERLLRVMFYPMTLALKFITPEKASAKLILDVVYYFLRFKNASRMGFLKGSPDDLFINPLADNVRKKGGDLRLSTKVTKLHTDGNQITGVELNTGEILTADDYLLALPVHMVQKLLPPEFKAKHEMFRKLDTLEDVPVISVQVWFDKKITTANNILFSPDGIIPVYADLSNTTPDYTFLRGKPHTGSRFGFCVAPAKDLMRLTDAEIIEKVLDGLRNCFPDESKDAKVLKTTVYRIPLSVYAPLPGADKDRPTQKTPIQNLFLAGGFTQQEYYDSMGGAVQSANLAAAAILNRV
jgi:15-cis-phytoene desaturase